MSAQDHPEPVEPVLTSVPGGLYCLVHGEMDCDLPFCWKCGSHLMDDFERCADPRCRASNGPLAREVVERVKAGWTDGPAPLELVALEIGRAYDAAGPSSPPGAAESVGSMPAGSADHP